MEKIINAIIVWLIFVVHAIVWRNYLGPAQASFTFCYCSINYNRHSERLICGIVFLTYLEAWALLSYSGASDIFVTGMRL